MVFGFFKSRRREKLKAEPFPQGWLEILQRNVPLYRRLSPEAQAELRGHVRVFLDEKSIEGAGGLEVDDEIRVTIAAQACVLLLHRETDYYPELDAIVVYPSGYRVPEERHVEGGVVVQGTSARLGESWSRGLVVLSWDGVLGGAARVSDGENLVFHEFAHQLDQETGDADGAPVLEARWMYQAWAKVLSREYADLVKADERGRRTLIDGYGATNPAEFFAVITELFFERPHALQRKHPELYQQLAEFYKQDPTRYLDG